jgi:hypothetical protein
VHQAFPTIPLLGIDILRDCVAGQLYVFEVNARGWTFHLSSDNYHRILSETGLNLRSQFGGATAIKRGIARRLRDVNSP